MIADDADGGNFEFATSPANNAGVITAPGVNVYGGDATVLTPSAGTNRQATWTFTDLEAGVYQISLSAIIAMVSPGATSIQVFVNGVPYAGLPSSLGALASTDDFRNVHGDSELAWRPLAVSVGVPAGETLSVKLTLGGGTGMLVADAVRLDRAVSTSYGYDKNGNVTTETDTRDNTTTHVYDELGREWQMISSDPDGLSSTLRSLVTERIFDGYGNTIEEDRGYRTSVTVVTRRDMFDYDRRNRLLEQVINDSPLSGSDKNVTTQYEYDAVGNLVTVTDALGYQTHYRYDDLNQQIDEYQEVTKGLSENAPLVVATYTAVGNTWTGLPISAYTVTHQTILEFDFHAEQLAQAYVIGIDTDTSYSDFAEKVHYFELGGINSFPAFFTTDFRQERLPDETIHVRIPIGQYLSEADKATGLSISNIVIGNIDGRTGLAAEDVGKSTFSNIKLYDSDEVRTVRTYDLLGNVETVREASDPREITTRYTYDRLGQLRHEYLDDGGTMARDYETTYDLVGNVKEERNNTAGTKTVHDYDRLYRLIKTTQPDPDGIATTPNGLVDTFTYDAVGNLIAETNGENETIRRQYNQLGQVISQTDGNGDETRYRYDSEGNLLSVTDAEQNTTKYSYDPLNRIATETNAFGTRSYVYNVAGNVDRINDRNGNHIKYVYDGLDRKTDEYWRNGVTPGTVPVHVLRWEYDLLDRVVKSVDGNTNYGGTSDDIVDTYVYDGLSRLTEQRNYDPAVSTQGQSSGIRRVRQTYRYVFQFGVAGTEFRRKPIAKTSTRRRVK